MYLSGGGLLEEVKTKILQEIHSGSLQTLNSLKEVSPNLHWSEIRYKKAGDTILHVAARLGFVDIVKNLLKNYIPKQPDCKNKDDKTPLHEAAQFCQFSVCKVLLENGANVNALKRADWTPLMLACTKSHNLETVKVLLNQGALVNYENKDGWTVLHLICREGDKETLQFLINNGLDIHRITKNGRSALHVACLHGHLEIVKLLLKFNLDVNYKDKCGNTPLHEAALGSSLPVFQYLVANNDVISDKNNSDFTCLHLAASVESLEIIKYIVKNLNVDVNVANKSRLTPLHCAAKNKKTGAISLLIELGADENFADKFGRCPRAYL